MATISYSRQATPDEMAAEIDRRGRVIEELEAKVATTIDDLMAANRRAADDAEHFIQAAVDGAPEPLRRLGEWLANKLDDDDWKTADRLLNGTAAELSDLKRQLSDTQEAYKAALDLAMKRDGQLVEQTALKRQLAGTVTEEMVRAFADEYWGQMAWEEDDLPNIRAALEAARVSGTVQTWQPVETAPKDGTEIWGKVDAYAVEKLSWCSAEALAEEHGLTPNDYDAGWFTENWEPFSPTHWLPGTYQPWPAAPDAKEG